MINLPCIDIQRHDVGIYGWTILYGSEYACSDNGDSSIVDCLASAAGSLPENERLVEIRYSGIHMGTFVKVQLINLPEGVADRIIESYGTLIAD